MTLALAIPEISLGAQKFKMDYGTVTTVLCPPKFKWFTVHVT